MRQYEVVLAEALDECDVRKFAMWDKIVGGFKGLGKKIQPVAAEGVGKTMGEVKGAGPGVENELARAGAAGQWGHAADVGRAVKEMKKHPEAFSKELDTLHIHGPSGYQPSDIKTMHDHAKNLSFEKEMRKKAGLGDVKTPTTNQINKASAENARKAKDWKGVATGAAIAAPVIGGGMYMAGRNGYFDNKATGNRRRR